VNDYQGIVASRKRILMKSKPIIISLGVLTLLCLGVSVFFSIYYVNSMPEIPAPELDRVYPLNVHGTIVYLTKNQDLLIKLSFWIGFFAGLGAVTLILISMNKNPEITGE